MKSKLILSVVGCAAAVTLLAGPALADPKPFPDQSTTLDCGNGEIPVTVNGNGRWTPAHDTTSTTVYVPVKFGDASFSVDGGDPEPDPEANAAKGGKRIGQGALECTYTIEGSFTDQTGEHSFVGVGEVWVKTAKA